jgi:hypothetical protein
MTETLRLREDRLEWREVNGEVVVLDIADSVYLSVNKTGSVLWPALVRGATSDELIQILRDSFSIDEAAAERDVDAFVSELTTRGLIDPA